MRTSSLRASPLPQKDCNVCESDHTAVEDSGTGACPEIEGATLEFYIRHISQNSGTKPVNQSITYSDTEGNALTFPDPSVKVDCGIIVTPEPCPTPVKFTVDGCEDFMVVDLGDTYLESTGRIVELDVTVRNVCPYKRVALGIILTEIDCKGAEYPRGVKQSPYRRIIINLPRYSVKCIRFVLPDDFSVSCTAEAECAAQRNLRARVIAHHIDTGYRCCDTVVKM